MSFVDGATGLTVTVPGAGARLTTVAVAATASLVAPARVAAGDLDAQDCRRGRRCRPARGRAWRPWRPRSRCRSCTTVLVGDAPGRRGSTKPLGVAVTVSLVRGGAGVIAAVPSTGAEFVAVIEPVARTTGLRPPWPSSAGDVDGDASLPRSPLPATLRSSVRPVAPAIGDAVAQPLVAVGERVAVDVGEAAADRTHEVVGGGRVRRDRDGAGWSAPCRPPCVLRTAGSLAAPLVVGRVDLDAHGVAAVAVAGQREVERVRGRARDLRAVAQPAVVVA